MEALPSPNEQGESPAEELVREVIDKAGKRMVTIHRRASGTFYFEQWEFSDEPQEMCWIPLPSLVSIYDSAETACKEAATRIPWFRESQTVKEENLS